MSKRYESGPCAFGYGVFEVEGNARVLVDTFFTRESGAKAETLARMSAETRTIRSLRDKASE